jgi:hypothetical protein
MDCDISDLRIDTPNAKMEGLEGYYLDIGGIFPLLDRIFGSNNVVMSFVTEELREIHR